MQSIEIIKLHNDAQLPVYQTTGSAGMDLSARLDAPVILQPMARTVIPTGIAIALPLGYEAQIRARSGLSSKYGITLVNGIGTIDSDYRGEVGALVVNLGQEAFTIEPGMRIAQMVIARYEQVDWRVVSELSETRRGAGGYGSTGSHT